MAEILKRNGYKTISYNGGAQLVAKFGFGQGFDLYDSFSDREDVSHDTFMKEVRLATGWIEKNPNEKFFFFLHTYETHHPYTPLKEDLDLLEKDYSGPLPANIPSELLRKINAGEVEIDLADQNHIISTYNAEIYSMDRAFGVLVDFLKKQNLYDNTLIIFTSDHGEEFEEHGMMGWHSHTLYDELLRVPLIIKFPNSEYAFTLIDEQTRNIDILPTMLDILNIPPLPQFEGESLLEWFSKTPRKQLLAISQLDADIQALPSSLRSDAYKLYNQELYDLKSDPLEHNDIARKNKKLFKSLQDELNSLLGDDQPFIEADAVELDKETVKRLRSLGYVN
jgi:arylsulfatase A-like enzyme